MKITKISIYHYDWVCDEDEGLQLSKGRNYNNGYPGRVVKIETDEGLVGWGEAVPHGKIYTEAFVEAIQPGLNVIAPDLIGMDPTNVEEVCLRMDDLMLGHPYIKDAVDTACWDIFGKFTNKPLYELWGGKLSKEIPHAAFLHRNFEKYRDVILTNLELFRSLGFSMFQSKACYGPDFAIRYIEFISKYLKPWESLWFDCNRGWTIDDALRVCKKASNISFYIEQPCETYEECRDVMRLTGVPVILDECMIKMKDLARAAVEGGIGGINLKIGRVGGPTKAKQMRDFCVAMRIPVYPMTTNSTEIGDAVLAHLGHSTPEYILRYSCVAHSLSASSTAEGLIYKKYKMSASDKPGLGLNVKEENLSFLQSWE